MRLSNKEIVATLALMTLFSSVIGRAGSSASTTAQALATVIASINISRTQDLNFGQAAPGDGAKTVGSADTINSAAFSVTGEASKVYTITLPSSTVTMTTSGGSTADRQIDITTFTSNPSSTGTLASNGTQTLYVGATRAAVRNTQETGSYSGTFTVTVAYQ